MLSHIPFLFKKSGAATSSWARSPDLATTRDRALTLGRLVGCDEVSSSAQLLQCLGQVPADEIVAQQQQVSLLFIFFFFPTYHSIKWELHGDNNKNDIKTDGEQEDQEDKEEEGTEEAKEEEGGGEGEGLFRSSSAQIEYALSY